MTLHPVSNARLEAIGLGARSDVAERNQAHSPNPRRPPNPFSTSLEPDWVPSAQPSDPGLAKGTFLARQPAIYNNVHSVKSSSSSAGQVQRKPVPPVPKKPSMLADARKETPETAPPVPPRPNEVSHNPTPTLMDDGECGASSIPPLEPSKVGSF